MFKHLVAPMRRGILVPAWIWWKELRIKNSPPSSPPTSDGQPLSSPMLPRSSPSPPLTAIIVTCSSFLGSLGTNGWALRSTSIVGVNKVVIVTWSFWSIKIYLLIVNNIHHFWLLNSDLWHSIVGFVTFIWRCKREYVKKKVILPQWFPGLLSVPELAFLEDIEGCKWKCNPYRWSKHIFCGADKVWGRW